MIEFNQNTDNTDNAYNICPICRSSMKNHHQDAVTVCVICGWCSNEYGYEHEKYQWIAG